MKGLAFAPVTSATALVGAVVPALAAGAGLDRWRFQGIFVERSDTSGNGDTLIFKDGRVRSKACGRHGDADAPYKATGAGEAVFFEAETESPRYRRLLWTRTVRDGKPDATATAISRGKAPVENRVVAGEKR